MTVVSVIKTDDSLTVVSDRVFYGNPSGPRTGKKFINLGNGVVVWAIGKPFSAFQQKHFLDHPQDGLAEIQEKGTICLHEQTLVFADFNRLCAAHVTMCSTDTDSNSQLRFTPNLTEWEGINVPFWTDGSYSEVIYFWYINKTLPIVDATLRVHELWGFTDTPVDIVTNDNFEFAHGLEET